MTVLPGNPWKFYPILLLLFLGTPVHSSTLEKPEVALVIGNERYESAVGPLRNSGNDAKAVARLLRKLGFKVTEKHDLKRESLLRTMDEFRKSLKGMEVALFYYAGHGVSIQGQNYLIPIRSGFEPAGADATSLRILAETRLFNAEQAIADMSAGGAKCTIAILDACRSTRLAIGRDRGLDQRGSLVEMTPPTGSLIAFATDSGHTALDGDGSNGLYTEELLKNLATPGITIEQVFKRTRSGVIRRSDGNQVPAEYSRLVGEDVYLAGPLPVQASAPATTSNLSPASPTRKQTLAAIQKLAEAGSLRSSEFVSELKALVSASGPGNDTVEPVRILLERVKEELKSAGESSTEAIQAAACCEKIIGLLPDCIPAGHPSTSELTARARSRLGDALLLLGHKQEALDSYNQALELIPNDPYLLYNRGRARLALGNPGEARADFQNAIQFAGNQSGARRLAREALEHLK